MRGKCAYLTLDSASWLQVWPLGDDELRVEHHYPRRAASVGYEDHPSSETGPRANLLNLVRRVLVERGRFDAGEITARLARNMSQMDIFGGETPVVELELPVVMRLLAEAERGIEGELAADEAGALIHARRGKHPADVRCAYCTPDGEDALERYRARLGSGAPAQIEVSSGWLTAGAPEPSGPSGAAPGARARSSDPATSHAAAGSLGSRFLRDSQEAIVRLFRQIGPMDDSLLVDRYQEAMLEGLRPNQSPSGIRTRRDELVRAGRVRDTGRTVRLQSGRAAIVWELVGTPPERRDATEPPL